MNINICLQVPKRRSNGSYIHHAVLLTAPPGAKSGDYRGDYRPTQEGIEPIQNNRNGCHVRT